jgi:hypothetical protein
MPIDKMQHEDNIKLLHYKINSQIIQAKETKEENDLFEEIMATNINIDHEKIMKELNFKDIFNDINFDLKNKINEDVEKNDYKICEYCNIPGKIHDTVIICENCGYEKELNSHAFDLFNATIDQNYNTSNNSFMTFNIVGTNSYSYHRSFLKTCADYTSYRNNNNKKEIINRIYQYEGNKPPANIINAAVDLFEQVKNKGYVYRGNGKLGVIGACLYYSCINNSLTRSPKEISLIMNIEERFLSHGDRVLMELNELGVISIQTNYKPLQDYLNQFFPALSIPDKYKQFVIDIIGRMEKKHLHIGNESRLTSKITGVIYLLTRRIPELKHIKKDTISKECNNISKSTFIKYYNLINDNYNLIKKCFRKHHIQQPIEWKN